MNATRYETPSQDLRDNCPTYNRWEWGLEAGGLDAPYKDRALALFGGDTSKLAARYSKRGVVYLAGGNDTEHLHGSCEDDGFQGKTRIERSYYYYESLKEYFGEQVHSRLVVNDVGHDHSLIFQSIQAIGAMFGDSKTKVQSSEGW